MPIFNKVARGFQIKTKVSEPKIEMCKSVGKETRNSSQQSIIQIIMKEAGLIHIDLHSGGITESIENNLKSNPVLKGAHPKKDHIVHKE